MATKSITEEFSALTNVASNAMQALASTIGEIAKQAANVASVFRQTTLTAGAMGAVMGGLATRSVQIFNPVVYERFQQAVRDLSATFGVIFSPVLERVTKLVRVFADWVYNLSPQTRQFVAVVVLAAVGFGLLAGAVALTTKAFAALSVFTGGTLAVIGGIVTGVAALAASFAMVSNTTSWVGKLGTSFRELLAPVEYLAGQLWGTLSQGLEGVAEIGAGMAETLKPAWNDLVEAMAAVVAELQIIGPQWKDFAMLAAQGLNIVLQVVVQLVKAFVWMADQWNQVIIRASVVANYLSNLAKGNVKNLSAELTKALTEYEMRKRQLTEDAFKAKPGGKSSFGLGGQEVNFGDILSMRQQFWTDALRSRVSEDIPRRQLTAQEEANKKLDAIKEAIEGAAPAVGK